MVYISVDKISCRLFGKHRGSIPVVIWYNTFFSVHVIVELCGGAINKNVQRFLLVVGLSLFQRYNCMPVSCACLHMCVNVTERLKVPMEKLSPIS